MNEKAVRMSECDELETLNLLQVDMQKRAEELKQLRLDLFPAVNEVSKENGNDDEGVTSCGVPEDSPESERLRCNGGQGSKTEDTLIETDHVTNTIGETVGPDNHCLISSSERESEKKSIPWTDLIATETKESVSLIAQSRSIPKLLLNGRQGYQNSVTPTYSDSPASIHKDFVSSATAQLEEGAATGRAFLDSLANENKLEEKLTLSELEVKSLQTKLSQIEEHQVKEVNKHKDTIQVLLQRIDQVSKQKQEEVSNREKEAKAHEDLIFKLTGIVQNAEKAMEMLEKKLEDAQQDLNQERMLSRCQQEVLRQIYESMKLAETDDRGDGTRDCATPQLICKLVKRYVDQRENQVGELLQVQKEAEERCKKLQKEMDEITVKLNAEYKERFTQLIEDQNKQLEAANERALNARQQTQGLQSQLQTMEQHSKMEIEAKSRQNSDFSERIREQEKKVEKLISEQQTELTRCREELTKTHELLDAKDLQITDMEKKVHFVEEKLEQTKLNLENAIRELNESQKERSKLDQLQLDTENKLSICRKMMQEKSEELVKVKKTTKLEEDKYKKEHQDEISGLKKEIAMKFMDETRKYEECRKQLNEELEKSEDNLRKKKCELKKTKELNKQQQCRIRELESNLEILNQEKSESVSQKEQAGRDLLVLQHERNLLENLYEKTKKEAQVELKDKSRMENVLKEMEPRYRELLIENQKLSSEMEKTGERLTRIESDRSQLMLEVRDRDERLEEISKIKSEVDGELEAKDKKLRELELKLKEAEELSKEKALITETLKTGMEKLHQTLQQANDKVLQLTNERTSLVEVSSKQKTNLEKDKRILSSQIKILQNELRLVKGRKNIENPSVNEQVDIAIQQGLVESMQGEITWLEERLCSTQEILRKEEEKVKGYQETQIKVQSKIERLEKERKEMIRRKKVQKTLVLKLESALEKTSVMFRESQQQNEKQAQELARMKLQYQLELKELKGNLVNQLTNTFVLPKLGKNPEVRVAIPEISGKAAVGGDQLRTKLARGCEMDQSQIVTVMNQVMKEMEKKQRDGENCNNSLQPLEVNYNNSETRSSSIGQKKQHHIEAECMSQQHGKRIINGDKSECFSSPDSSLSKPGSASSAKLDSPVSILLSRGCLPQEMTKNTADLSKRTHLDADKRTNARLDRKELYVSTGHQEQDHKMKGFVDKLDKLTLMGNQLIDENMEMEMLLVEQEEQR